MAETSEKQYSILMTDALAQKTHDGEKTNTRRVIILKDDSITDLFDDDQVADGIVGFDTKNYHNRRVKCRYGKVGAVAAIKENYFAFGKWETDGKTKTGHTKFKFIDLTGKTNASGTKDYIYAATGQKPMCLGGARERQTGAWMWWKRPSIFMPCRAVRSFVEITDLRVERVQDISEADAEAEGVRKINWKNSDESYADYRTAFAELWDEINEDRGFGWDANPWIWAITYKKI